MDNQENVFDKITAGISELSKEELQNMKEAIKQIDNGDGELSMEEAEKVMAGIPYYEAKEQFENNFPKK